MDDGFKGLLVLIPLQDYNPGCSDQTPALRRMSHPRAPSYTHIFNGCSITVYSNTPSREIFSDLRLPFVVGHSKMQIGGRVRVHIGIDFHNN